MAGDIEEFLRRAAERRAPQPPAAAPARRPPQAPQPYQILGDDDVVDGEIVDADIVEDPGIMSGRNVGDHVAQHIDTSDFGERISQLGVDVDQADDRMEAHMHEYFEHSLGDLGAKTSRASDSTLDDDSGPQLGANDQKKLPRFNIRKLMRSPGSIRDAIVLSEILRRPDNSW